MSKTREKILDTAIDLFSERGYNDVSVRELTQAVGIKESSLYNHFENKQQILDTIYQELLQSYETMTLPLKTIMEMLENMSLEEFLELAVRNFDNYMAQPRMRKIWRIISIERFRDERAREFFNRYLVDSALEYQTKVFEGMIRKGLIKDWDPRALARETHGFMLFVYFRYMEFDPQADLKEVREMVMDHMKFLTQAIRK
jgi:AcrR family transcriptional regulator